MGLPLFLVALDLEREGFKLFTELSQMLEMEQGHCELLEGSIAHPEAPAHSGATKERPLDAA